MVEVAAAVIKKNDKFLMCQRPKDKKCALLWEFAGGKVEKGESIFEATVRECQEELGITVTPIRELFSVIHDYPSMTVNLHFVYSTTEDTPKRLEHNALAWLPLDEIPKLDLCPADYEIFEKYNDILKSL